MTIASIETQTILSYGISFGDIIKSDDALFLLKVLRFIHMD